MRSKSAGDKTGFLLILRLELFKHRRHCPRIISRGVHVLNAKFVGFLFCTATELHEDPEQADACSVLINHSRNPAQEYRRTKCGIFQKTCFRLVLDGMTSGNVCDFVSHHAGQLGFIICRQQQTLVYIKESTRQRESVHFVRIYDFNRERNFCVGMQNDILADPIYVFSNDWVFDELGLPINFSSRFTPHSYFLLCRPTHLSNNPAVDIALANHVRVFIG